MVPQILRHDPAYLDEVISAMPRGELRQQVVRAKLRILVTHDAEAAIELARQSESKIGRGYLLSEAGLAITQEDPQRALRLYQEVVESGVLPETIPYSHTDWVRKMVRRVPLETLEIAHASENEAALKQASDNWMSHDQGAFVDWVETIPARERDPYYYRVAVRFRRPSQENLANAVTWISQIQDESLRVKAIDRISANGSMNLELNADAAYWESSERTAAERAVHQALQERRRQ
jgi:hypothetical protein